MYHNGHDYKNLQEYVEVGYDLHPHEFAPNDKDDWMERMFRIEEEMTAISFDKEREYICKIKILEDK